MEPTLEPTLQPTVAPTVEPETFTSETVKVEIKNVEKVFTPEEKAVLETLPVKEQVITVLSVLGVHMEVVGDDQTVAHEISEEAAALQAQITQRFEAMSEEELAQFQKTIVESFPVRKVQIDGVEHTMFVIELEVVDGDEVRTELYGLEFVDGVWVLVQLNAEDVAMPEETTAEPAAE